MDHRPCQAALLVDYLPTQRRDIDEFSFSMGFKMRYYLKFFTSPIPYSSGELCNVYIIYNLSGY